MNIYNRHMPVILSVLEDSSIVCTSLSGDIAVGKRTPDMESHNLNCWRIKHRYIKIGAI